ncbi:hypothetical protein BT96DRAFT_923262 [Gymnopus androsaceus JB14]|uniref:FAD/NAD(P)-binding domain-containing protein n=1 Tax=Gymnopus androsaceus JB14 TaxID=1447944 RepID=A0A6A4H9V7_9AGAR|nr:hypothetical protein BT96DRAFT_923262 [Gymnopus androsaceus JB14]
MRRSLFDDSVGILGSGAAGLITAYTLLKDGFSNVTILTADKTVGGVWAEHRVYPGLTINSVHGEFRFSPLAMTAPDDPTGRLTGMDMCAYMRNFADSFLAGKIRYCVTVKKVYRPIAGSRNGWLVDVENARFLHTTWLGGKLTQFIWNMIQESSFAALRIPRDSPLRNASSLFWTTQTNDEGVPRDDGFHALVNKGNITLVSPARATAFGADGHSILLNDGRRLEADTVILATGYSSSWNIFDEQTAINLGMKPHLPDPSAHDRWHWDYTTLAKAPRAHMESSASIYRGIVPASNLLNHDFAINGAIFTTNNGYSYEVVSHWISSYFLRDPYLRLPKTVEEALEESERNAAWIRRRYPGTLLWASPSYSGNVAFWTWPQAMDDLLRDMGLKTGRSGGNWLTWPFRVIQLNEIATLGEERRARWHVI